MEQVGAKAQLRGQRHTPERLCYAMAEGDWSPMRIGEAVLPGFSRISLGADESGAWSSYWMRIDPGATSPEHVHMTTELLVVWQGIFTDSDGTDFGPGETVIYQAGSRHRSFSKDGCIVLVVTTSESEVGR
ncbi:cupin domain-containing protein [Cupriavidus sp. NPDC089707]|uniref:cupin domain-containing protein n=1 Tax=Cupriavidus sp. NPDC089707 TaxID=3363963 RepID=UPI00381702AE